MARCVRSCHLKLVIASIHLPQSLQLALLLGYLATEHLLLFALLLISSTGAELSSTHHWLIHPQFYVMVVVYIYFTRIVVYLLKSTMQYDYAWVSEAADQLATLAFYVWTAVKFRPQVGDGAGASRY